MPITIYGDGYVTGLANVTTAGGVTASNVALGNITLTQNNLLGNLSTNGWQRLPSGLILQWGRDTATGAEHFVTFPIAFPSVCLSVTVSGLANGTYFIPYTRDVISTGYKQGFYATGGANGAATTWDGRFMAVGY